MWLREPKRGHDDVQRVPKQGRDVRDLMCQRNGYYDGALAVANGTLFWPYHDAPESGVAHASAAERE